MVSSEPEQADWGHAVLVAFIQQFLALVLLSLSSESGPLLLIWFFTFCAFWAGAAIIALRRGRSPTRTDMALVRIGFWPLLLAAIFVAAFVWNARGHG